ncbi:unnamed protein product [Rangifer tarandus platyrhynchus]|uniref:Uncharacterized protein n=1 Tax=Rangifer tarandus platyrhynchus TaxID=3082113 RepID=A0ABN8YHT7_RANTA|nr:unnamed protein product [Rangifer tarandus platyrhynchus]
MCPTLLSLLSLGFCVSLRIWAAVGEYEKHSLSAWPSPVVPLGQTVTLQCHSCSPLAIFRLFKRDGTSLPELQGHHVNTFTLGPVTRDHAGSYTCCGFDRSLSVWSGVSDLLQIVVTGVFTKPAISAHPGPLMKAGENVTLRCHSMLLFDKFILHQENSTGHFQRCGETLPGGNTSADFFIGPMTLESAGTYRCYGSLSRSPYEWSAPSDPVDIVITGLSKEPSLSAQGGPVVRSGENVTLLCSSEHAFDQFHLLREGENLGSLLAGRQGPRGALQAAFPLGPGTPDHSGTYRCYGSFTRSPYAWSDPSDPLLLSVTVPSVEGENLGRLLTGDQDRCGALQAEFPLGPGTPAHSGTYRCYGSFTRSPYKWSDPSDPLLLSVTGVFTKPSISAHPGPIVRAGGNVTIRCHSPLLLDKFMLHKIGNDGHFQGRGETFTGRHAPADFSIGPMTLASAGSYRCYGSLSRSPYEWSAPSDPVDIVITGLSKEPSLSAQGGPVVRSGENVTLLCSSEHAFDQFHLLREGENLGSLLAGRQGPRGALQAAFPLGPGTPDHSGTYRCYGSFTRSPYAWSDPSDPLLLSVTESTTSTCPSSMDPHTTEEARLPQGHSSQLHLLLRLSVAFIYTSLFLAVLVCHWLPKN